MPSNTGSFSHLLAPGLWDIFFNKYNQYPTEYDKIFNIRNSTRAFEEDSEIMGLGAMVKKNEGEAITYDDPTQAAGLKRYTHDAFALGFRVTHELYKDDLYGIINRMPQALSKSAHQTIETQSWAILNNAFTTAGRDGVALCATNHPNVAVAAGSGPYSNRLSTDADLSVTSLQSAIQLMETTTDDRDLNIMLKPRRLVIHPNTKWAARELLQSQLKPYTNDNEINALMDEDLQYMVSHYLTDTDAWFLMTDKSDHYLNFFWREKLSFDNDDDFDTGDAKFKAMMRFSVGFSGWRGVVGTTGA
uniref:Putative capsid protein n=1 Tax=viral metagenome TaxID=1070528 RepID=A0A6H1ZMW1_9ZZZZ